VVTAKHTGWEIGKLKGQAMVQLKAKKKAKRKNEATRKTEDIAPQNMGARKRTKKNI